MNIIFKI